MSKGGRLWATEIGLCLCRKLTRATVRWIVFLLWRYDPSLHRVSAAQCHTVDHS
jgi:hypothetical protein